MDALGPLDALADDVDSSREEDLRHEIQLVKWSFKVFQGNFFEIDNMLRSLEESPEMAYLWEGGTHRAELHRAFEEVGRLLHNFVLSAMSLVDHTRRHVNRYTHDEYADLADDYNREIKRRFRNGANHQLIQGLRNYISHRRLPLVGSVLSWTESGQMTRTFYVPLEPLLEWDKWSSLAREKLEELEGRLPIRQFVDAYYTEVADFHNWLWSRVRAIHLKKWAVRKREG